MCINTWEIEVGEKMNRCRFLPLLLVLVGLAAGAQAAALPSSSDVDGILKACGAGISQSVQGAIKGEISIWRREAEGSGKVSVDDLGGILSKLPEGQQIDHVLYDTYVGCIKDLVSQYLQKSENDPFVGKMKPGHDPTPSGPCHPVPDALIVYLGEGAEANGVVARNFPVPILRISGKDILVLNRDQDKSISIDLFIYGDDGRSIVTILHNTRDINEHNAYNMALSTDQTNLKVQDRQKDTVLDITYINEAVVRMTGIIRYGKYRIDISPIGMKTMHIEMTGSCSYFPGGPLISLHDKNLTGQD
jgi:hypothetical protein